MQGFIVEFIVNTYVFMGTIYRLDMTLCELSIGFIGIAASEIRKSHITKALEIYINRKTPEIYN